GLGTADFGHAFQSIAETFHMRWRLELSAERPKVAVYVSHYDHCLADLLYRHESAELVCDIPCIISNHPDAPRLAEFHRIPFHHIPVSTDKAEAERRLLPLSRDTSDCVMLLARYRPIL